MTRFDICLDRILKHEGGFVQDIFDSGGMTNLGVTKRVWEEFVGHPVSEADMRSLTVEKVSKLYKQRYWDRVQADKLPPGVDYICMDFAVNAGVGRSIKTLQSAVGATADGIIGNQTLTKINSIDPKKLINDLSDARIDFYQGIVARKPDQARFIKGWLNRVEDSRRTALEQDQG